MKTKRDSDKTFFDALYEGYVTNRTDPEALGRVKVSVPGVLEPESDWIRPMATFGGSAQRGIFAVPAVNANIVVLFKNGDPRFPRYIAGPWGRPGGVSEVPLQAEQGNPDVVVFRFGKAAIIFDERVGQEKLTLLDVDNQSLIRFDMTAKSVALESAQDFERTVGKDEKQTVTGKETRQVAGDSERTIGGKESGQVTGDAELTVGGKWTVTVVGDAKISSTGKAEIVGASEAVVDAAVVKGGAAAAFGVALESLKAWLDGHIHSGGTIQGMTGIPSIPTLPVMFSTKFKAE